MDRLAIAALVFGLVVGVVGLARGRDALNGRTQATRLEARATAVQRDLDRLRSAVPADPQPLPAITDTLARLERDMSTQPTPLRVHAEPDPTPRLGNPWAPLIGQAVKITMQTDVSPVASVAWLDTMLQNYTLLLTGIEWDGRIGIVRAVVLGP